MEETKDISIWSEGFAATGDSGGATFHETVRAESLKEACSVLAETSPGFAKYYNEKRMTFWGCRLYDNEIDARRSFG